MLSRSRARRICQGARRNLPACESLDCHHRDVIRLTKPDRFFGDDIRRLGGDGACSLEAEEFAGRGLGFHNPVRVEGQTAPRRKLETNRRVVATFRDSQRQGAGEFDFASIEVRRKMAGVW